jgi:nicotinamidase-related amidase
MLFSSNVFLFLVLPVVLAVYYVVHDRTIRNAFLFLVSLVFYVWGETFFAFIMIGVIIFNYRIALFIDGKKDHGKTKKLPSEYELPLKNITFPIGISFFTFQAMSYPYTLQRQRIAWTEGFRCWKTSKKTVRWKAAETAFIIVDMWDRHWSEGASRRSLVLAEKINAAAVRARNKGILVVHAPSDTMDFYRGVPARERFLSLEAPGVIPEPVILEDHSQPVDSSDGGSDTVDSYPRDTLVWKRQSEMIAIDQDRDLLCGDEGDRLCAHLVSRRIRFLIYAGVHANMCILDRSFAIKAMRRRGFQTALIRDLTDAMYNPEKPPYVSHEEGTALVTGYIEKFYSPTIDSAQI